MADRLCTQSSSKSLTMPALLQAGEAFDCSENKYAVTGPRVWVKIPFLDDTLAAGAVEVQGDNNGLTTMQIHAVLDDGSIYSSHFSEKELAANWRPKGQYGLVVPGSQDPEIRNRIKQVYIAIDDPKVASSMSLIQLASVEKWDALQLPLSVMFAVLCGMAIMPLIYNAFFYGALRYRFMLWHCVMIGAIVAYTFGSSGLIFVIFPEISLTTKMLINYWSLAIGVAASAIFLIHFIEKGKIERWLQALMFLTAMLPLAVTAIVLPVDGNYDMEARNYYHASFLPAFFTVLYTMGHALRRGSKAIWFQIAGWTPIVMFSLDRVARGLDLYIGWPVLDYGLYFTLVIETIILALGVANRIFHMRQQHENTLLQQVELTLLADTDGLTTMNNRRSFEKEFRRNQRTHSYGHLAILDIDYFKRVNDRYGHEVGDEVLRVVGRQLNATPHFASRIGGEEFTLLMPQDNRENRKKYPVNALTEICETLIKAVSDQVPQILEPVTFSVGVAAISKHASLRSIMATADRRLYDAKNNGRNQIVWLDISDANPTKPAGSISA
ncbi:diguanylate cyclase [Parasphingorhabdus sp.]|uniref:sensor domain-containing diguanylate cyclase n=1 Tax=Parasphingorhabdus sp. TaxID=2709688 RepID=UPI0032645680